MSVIHSFWCRDSGSETKVIAVTTRSWKSDEFKMWKNVFKRPSSDVQSESKGKTLCKMKCQKITKAPTSVVILLCKYKWWTSFYGQWLVCWSVCHRCGYFGGRCDDDGCTDLGLLVGMSQSWLVRRCRCLWVLYRPWFVGRLVAGVVGLSARLNFYRSSDILTLICWDVYSRRWFFGLLNIRLPRRQWRTYGDLATRVLVFC